MKDKQEITREHQRPTCQGKWSNKAQLTYHRKKSKQCQAEYWRELKKPKECKECGKEYKTEKDLEKHKSFHCGKERTEEGEGFKKTTEEDIIDRRTMEGFGVPKTRLYTISRESGLQPQKEKLAMYDMRENKIKI